MGEQGQTWMNVWKRRNPQPRLCKEFRKIDNVQCSPIRGENMTISSFTGCRKVVEIVLHLAFVLVRQWVFIHLQKIRSSNIHFQQKLCPTFSCKKDICWLISIWSCRIKFFVKRPWLVLNSTVKEKYKNFVHHPYQNVFHWRRHDQVGKLHG